MSKDARESLLLPILMPVGILLVILAIAVGFSRLLLSLTSAGATVVAVSAALTIMVFASVAATRTRLRGGALLAALAGIVGLVMFFGGTVLSLVGGPEKGAGAQAGGGPTSPSMVMGGQSPSAAPSAAPSASPQSGGGAKAVTLSITAPSGAAGTGYAEKTLTAPAGAPIKLTFTNQDTGVPHNIEIWSADPLKDPSAKAFFQGDQITGPATTTYDVPPLSAGTYFYRCVVHPTTMMGALTVK